MSPSELDALTATVASGELARAIAEDEAYGARQSAPDLEPLYAAVRAAEREAWALDGAYEDAYQAYRTADEASQAAWGRLQDARLALRRAQQVTR